MKRLLVALVLAVVLSLALAGPVFAAEVPLTPGHPGCIGIETAAANGAPVSYPGMP